MSSASHSIQSKLQHAGAASTVEQGARIARRQIGVPFDPLKIITSIKNGKGIVPRPHKYLSALQR